MKIVIVSLLCTLASAFVPQETYRSASRELHAINRREILLAGVTGLVAQPAVSTAAGSTFFFDEKIELVREESQMRTDGLIDVNNAFVSEYKIFPGMFPHAAGKIASNGPYRTVKDIYRITGLTDHDKEVFKKYEKAFTCNPPGRAFKERINQRFST